MNLAQANLDQTTQPTNTVNQSSSGNNVNETAPNIPEATLDQTTQPENVVNQSPLNLADQATGNLQPEYQPSSGNYNGELIIFYQTCTSSIIFR